MKIPNLFREFIESEKASGMILILCTAISLACANSYLSYEYTHIWHAKFVGQSVEYWINDGLMAIFFLLIGLELKREIYVGELSRLKEAMLPIFGAIGGMLVPAAIYLSFNYNAETRSGAGIPMATDIAFALGVLSLLGSRVPASLKVFLTALAVIDDLGAILVIAVFYTKTLVLMNLFIALGILGVLFVLNVLKIRSLIPYLLGGTVMWYFMLNSGVHATITGVLVAMTIPFEDGGEQSASSVLQHFLHKPVGFLILPLFALSNTAIVLAADIGRTFTENYSLGIALGLIVGKPLGIFSLAFAAVKMKICRLPQELNWKAIFGAGCLGGIGFTMSIFITLLAFEKEEIISSAKLVILSSSLVAAVIGLIFLNSVLKQNSEVESASVR
jgi:Na+:H+ antiporter, NhaA family